MSDATWTPERGHTYDYVPARPRLLDKTVLISTLLEQDGDPIDVRRSWRERLFTRPWRPWQSTRTYTPKVPFEGAVRLDAHTFVMHPTTYARLRAALDYSKPSSAR